MFKPKAIQFCIAIFLGILTSIASAEEFGLFSKHEELKMNVIVDSGNFEKIEYDNGSSNKPELFKLNSVCFRPSGFVGYWTYGKKAGFVLIDRSNVIRVAIIEPEVASIKIETYIVEKVACPKL